MRKKWHWIRPQSQRLFPIYYAHIEYFYTWISHSEAYIDKSQFRIVFYCHLTCQILFYLANHIYNIGLITLSMNTLRIHIIGLHMRWTVRWGDDYSSRCHPKMIGKVSQTNNLPIFRGANEPETMPLLRRKKKIENKSNRTRNAFFDCFLRRTWVPECKSETSLNIQNP